MRKPWYLFRDPNRPIKQNTCERCHCALFQGRYTTAWLPETGESIVCRSCKEIIYKERCKAVRAKLRLKHLKERAAHVG
jgi:RNase P subunit RPR2